MNVLTLVYLAATVASACGLGIGLRLTLKTKGKRLQRKVNLGSFRPVIRAVHLPAAKSENPAKNESKHSNGRAEDFCDAIDRVKSFLEGQGNGAS